MQRQINQQTDRATDSAALNRVVFRRLERHHNEPFFRYAHAIEPHAPYEPPPENAADDFAIIGARWKFMYRNNAAKFGIKKVELYDRVTDRSERHDVSAQHLQQVEEVVSRLAQWIEAQNNVRSIIGHTGRSQLDQQTLERLRSLGYLGGSSQ
jgi:hypothetical protein